MVVTATLAWNRPVRKNKTTYGGESHFGLKQTQTFTHETRNGRDSHFGVKQRTDLYGQTRMMVTAALAWSRKKTCTDKPVWCWQPLWLETDSDFYTQNPPWLWHPLWRETDRLVRTKSYSLDENLIELYLMLQKASKREIIRDTVHQSSSLSLIHSSWPKSFLVKEDW